MDGYTLEELYLEWLEDYYQQHPAEIQKFLDTASARHEAEWDGSIDSSILERAAKVFKKVRQNTGKTVNLKQYQNPNENVSAEDFAKIFDALGRNLPGSSIRRDMAGIPALGDGGPSGEFEDVFEE